MSNIKNQILDFVRDHWENFGAYPMEVETEEEFLTWDQYWSYITEEELSRALKGGATAPFSFALAKIIE